MTRYATGTTVPVGKTRTEIEQTLHRFGASGFAYGWDTNRAMVGFVLRGRQIRMHLTLPDKAAKEFTHTPGRGLRRHPDDAHRAWEAACRSSWRELLLIIKAKLVAVESGIVTMDEEFLAYTVLPNGATVGQHAIPAVQEAYETGRVPSILPAAALAIEGGGR